jgi:hypothetical protein
MRHDAAGGRGVHLFSTRLSKPAPAFARRGATLIPFATTEGKHGATTMMIEIEPMANITLAGLYARRKQIRARLMQPQSAALPMIDFRSPAPAGHRTSIAPSASAQAVDVTDSSAEAPPAASVVDPPSRAAPTARDIVRAVAAFHGISTQELVSRSRLRRAVTPRQIAHFLAKTLMRKSLPQIGRLIGGRDHTTVLHSIRKIDARRAADPAVAAEIEQLIAKLSSDKRGDRCEQDATSDAAIDNQIQENQPEHS